MVPFGQGCRGDFHRPLCERRRKAAWSTGALMEFVIAVCWGGGESPLNQGDAGRALHFVTV